MAQDSILFGAARSGLKTTACALDELPGRQFATFGRYCVVDLPCSMRDPLRSHWLLGRLAIATHAIHESNVETSKTNVCRCVAVASRVISFRRRTTLDLLPVRCRDLAARGDAHRISPCLFSSRSITTLLPEANFVSITRHCKQASSCASWHRTCIGIVCKGGGRWGGLFVRTRDIDRRIEVGRQTTSRDILLDESL
jgi:hypothetical protein